VEIKNLKEISHFAEIFVDMRIPQESCPCMPTHHEGRRQTEMEVYSHSFLTSALN
jgi:hypothetical protein